MASYSRFFASSSASQKQPMKSYALYADIDSEDNANSDLDGFQIAADTVPGSPQATQPTQIIGRSGTLTQPTQILGPKTRLTQATQIISPRPGVSSKIPFGQAIPSSPCASSDIEIPASSPFQDLSANKHFFGNKIAPAGTAFRQPQLYQLKSPTSAKMRKRPAPEPIQLSSDDDNEISPRRGDIKRTDFSRRISQFAHTTEGVGAATARNTTGLPTSITSKQHSDKENADSPAQPVVRRRRLMRGLPPREPSVEPKAVTVTATAAVSAESPAKRRRLQRGSRPQSTSVQSPWSRRPIVSSPDPLNNNEPILIESSAEEEGGFEADTESDDEPEIENKNSIKSRVLDCLNEAPLDDLKAMSRRDESDLKQFTSKRPFDSVAVARAVIARKPGARKAVRIPIGDAIVDDIFDFLRATEAIDSVVAECEIKATQAKREMDTWNVDMCGVSRPPATPLKDEPLTPGSPKEYRDPPIPQQPEFMEGHCQMKEFQRFGLNWMNMCYNNRIGCILADEMGLGKTCQVISFMCHLVASGQQNGEANWPNLIVVPPSTYDNWLAEFEKFSGNNLNIIGYQGSQLVRSEVSEKILETPERYHVILTTYTQVVAKEDRKFLRHLNPVVAVFDEGHKMKNPETKLYKALRYVEAKWHLLLTGTPVQNSLSEMIALVSFINPKLFDKRADKYLKIMFNSKVSARDVGNSAFLYSERVMRARTILEPFILRRVKQQVIEMPAKVRNIVYCDLPDTQRPIYEEYEACFRHDVCQAGKRVKSKSARANDQNNVWMQLRKAALHPRLFRRFFDDAKVEKMADILYDKVGPEELRQENMVHLVNELKNLSDFELHLWCRDYDWCLGEFDMPADAALESGKVTKLLEMIAEYQKNGDRVLVFSKFAKMLDIIAEVLATEDIPHCILSGQTNVQERQALIDDFSADESIPVFLLTTAAGGTGINLTAANKVIIFDQSDNPQDDIQAENRAHRLGQSRDVEIIRLIARDTVEELIYRACEKKMQLADKVTGAEEEATAATAAVEQTLETEVRNMMGKQQTPP